MKANLVIGMIAGSLIGATAAVIAMPYFQPHIRRAINRGRQAINTHMDKMESTPS
jgi:gas vesicle protein